MFFQSKKKRLWRARVTQSANCPQQHQHRKECSQKCVGSLEEYHCAPDNQYRHLPNHNYMNSRPCSNLLLGSEIRREDISNGYSYESAESSIDVEDDDRTMSLATTKSTAIIMPVNQSVNLSTSTTTAVSVFRNCCGGGYSSSSTLDFGETFPSTIEQKEMFRALVGKLKESQLTTLCQAIENGAASGGQQPDCVLVPRGRIMGEEPNVIACRIWRWPDIKNCFELKCIPSCPSEKDPIYVCCNPSHWSRLCLPDTPPPPYHQLFTADKLRLEEDRSASDSTLRNCRLQPPESLTTDGEDSSATSWCQLAYWELAQRVGGRFPVESPSVNIFSDQPRGDGMCLKTLAEQRQTATPESVLKARQKIGLGVTLSQEPDGVWLYNRSTAPVFVHSPTLNDIDCWFHVSKVPPGYCLRAFDNYKAKTQSIVWPPQIAGAQTGPVDTHSMRISFAKGWGPNYSRQDVTACPCWLEVLFPRR